MTNHLNIQLLNIVIQRYRELFTSKHCLWLYLFFSDIYWPFGMRVLTPLTTCPSGPLLPGARPWPANTVPSLSNHLCQNLLAVSSEGSDGNDAPLLTFQHVPLASLVGFCPPPLASGLPGSLLNLLAVSVKVGQGVGVLVLPYLPTNMSLWSRVSPCPTADVPSLSSSSVSNLMLVRGGAMRRAVTGNGLLYLKASAHSSWLLPLACL